MDSIRDSNNEIGDRLMNCISDEERSAILSEKGDLCYSASPLVVSVIKKMDDFKPKERLLLDLVSQEYIMRRVRDLIRESKQETNLMEVIENEKKNTQDEVGLEEAEQKSEAYGNQIFNVLTDMFYNQMDENNKRAAEAGKKGGTKAAVNMMFESAGGDYARMRSMYG